VVMVMVMVMVVLVLMAMSIQAASSRSRSGLDEEHQQRERAQAYPVVSWNNWSKEVWRKHAKYILAESPLTFSHGMDIMDPYLKNIDPRTLEGGWQPQAKPAQYYPGIGGTGQHANAHSPWPRITPSLVEVSAAADDLPVECVNCEFRELGQ